MARTGRTSFPTTSTSASYLRSTVLLTTTKGAYALGKTSVKELKADKPSPTPTDKPKPKPEPTPEPEPAFFTYRVQPGDTVEGIAGAFGIQPDYILWNNSDVAKDPDHLLIGQKLLIPSVNGIVYTVRLGDTLTDIAQFYQIGLKSIAAFVPNGITSPDMVIEGMVLLLPGAVPPPPPPPIVEAVAVVENTAPQPDPTPAATPVPVTSGLIWPFSGPISSPFGDGRGHLGIDIDGIGQYGAPVVAAAAGTVVLVAYQDYGLGNHVIVHHPNGMDTVYAHLSQIYVTQGQTVSQGQAVGALGCTGYCTGPHLHFEVHVDGIPVDPLLYLP
ncbi:MAG: M23 family metallopeptidase [Chloroflexi bacterium]|nr:M23 family metallopeptidase [Chloroflexota bacterium]